MARVVRRALGEEAQGSAPGAVSAARAAVARLRPTAGPPARSAFVSAVGGNWGVTRAVPPPTPTAPSSSTAYTRSHSVPFVREALERVEGQEAGEDPGTSVVDTGAGRSREARVALKPIPGPRAVPRSQVEEPGENAEGLAPARCASEGAIMALLAPGAGGGNALKAKRVVDSVALGLVR